MYSQAAMKHENTCHTFLLCSEIFYNRLMNTYLDTPFTHAYESGQLYTASTPVKYLVLFTVLFTFHSSLTVHVASQLTYVLGACLYSLDSKALVY